VDCARAPLIAAHNTDIDGSRREIPARKLPPRRYFSENARIYFLNAGFFCLRGVRKFHNLNPLTLVFLEFPARRYNDGPFFHDAVISTSQIGIFQKNGARN
jgi:hypothetical protein